MSIQLVYLSHPIGPAKHIEELVKRHDNIAVASAWLRYLIKKTRWAIVSPVLSFCAALDAHDSHSPRALTDQVHVLERCDLMVQVGGILSPHMVIERNHAARKAIPVVDLLFFGVWPPNEDDETAAGIIERHTLDVSLARPRAIWLPPLGQDDIDKLRRAQLSLANDPFNKDEADVVKRIVESILHVWPEKE